MGGGKRASLDATHALLLFPLPASKLPRRELHILYGLYWVYFNLRLVVVGTK